ncbi:MAG: hypothetical protein QNJ90_01815 [Planctomycetota bacterium]|nr:hypothetical protein [Planctomycetota bacterium]
MIHADPRPAKPPPEADAAAPFLGLSRRVERRIWTARWLDALRATALPLFGLAVVGLAAAWLTGTSELPVIARAVFATAIVAVLLWVAGCAVWSRLRDPGHTAALALFDERSGTHEMFVSAYALARDPQRGPGAELHLRRAHAALESAARKLDEAVPVRAAPASIVAPFVFLVVAFFGLPAAALPPAEEDATEQAAVVGESLDEEARTLEKLEKGLSDEEREKLEELKAKLKDSAQKMANLEKDKSARDVLQELEKRARDAEKLAEMLGAGSEKLTSAMLAELERHADTAELAGALRGQKLDDASTESQKLARRLRAENLSLEARKRIESAFTKGLEAATADDLKTLLGQHMTAAQAELDESKPQRAADEFDRLARRYQQMARRLRNMDALKRLAQNLRASGQKALGNNQGAMRRIAGLSKGGLSRVGSQPVKFSLGSQRPGSNNSSSTPGTGQPGNNSNSGQNSGAPVPGTAGPPKPPCPT